MDNSVRLREQIQETHGHEGIQSAQHAGRVESPAADREDQQILLGEDPHEHNRRITTIEQGHDTRITRICCCLLGHNACSHARTAWVLLPTVIADSPAQVAIYHATRLQSRGESGKRMRRSRCCTGCVWLGVEP